MSWNICAEQSMHPGRALGTLKSLDICRAAECWRKFNGIFFVIVMYLFELQKKLFKCILRGKKLAAALHCNQLNTNKVERSLKLQWFFECTQETLARRTCWKFNEKRTSNETRPTIRWLTYDFELNARVSCGTFVKVNAATVDATVRVLCFADDEWGRCVGCLEICSAPQALLVQPVRTFVKVRCPSIETRIER